MRGTLYRQMPLILSLYFLVLRLYIILANFTFDLKPPSYKERDGQKIYFSKIDFYSFRRLKVLKVRTSG